MRAQNEWRLSMNLKMLGLRINNLRILRFMAAMRDAAFELPMLLVPH